MGKFIYFFAAAALILVCTMVWTPPAEAYETYWDPSDPDARNGYCKTCHPTFSGRGALHDLHVSPLTNTCLLCHTGSGFDNPFTMWSGGGEGADWGCVGCHGRDYDETRGSYNNGLDVINPSGPKMSAYGLRLRHELNGVGECVACHGDVLPQPEGPDNVPPPNVTQPPYYQSAGGTQTTITGTCNGDNSEDGSGDNVGLDNDGDGLYDGNDPDCQGCMSNADCNDGLFCNGAETCNTSTGECEPGTPPSCDDGVGCTDDSCDAVSDICVNDPNDALCDNGQFCDGVETCDPQLDCQPGTPVECPPGETCDEGTDQCVPDAGCTTDADCDDGLYCNGTETCNTSTNECQAGTPPDCGDGVGCTVDSCNEGTDSCDNEPDDASCDNGFFCDGVEFCDPALDCQPGTPPDCDDGVGCTDDSCNTTTDACDNNPNDANCPDDGIFCNGTEYCDPAADCSSTGDPCLAEESCNEDLGICEGVGGPLEVEIEVPGSINATNKGKTPIHIEFPDSESPDSVFPNSNSDLEVEIAELYCGGNVSDAMAEPWRINPDDEEYEFVALFITLDLMLDCEDTMMICAGSLADGTLFMGMDDLRVIRDADGRCGRGWDIGKIRWQP